MGNTQEDKNSHNPIIWHPRKEELQPELRTYRQLLQSRLSFARLPPIYKHTR